VALSYYKLPFSAHILLGQLVVKDKKQKKQLFASYHVRYGL